MSSDKYPDDLSGMRFGDLIVIEPTSQRQFRSVVWRCRCACGRETFVPRSSILSGNTKSCGHTHQVWRLISPSGNEIVVTDLSNWAFENAPLFGKPKTKQSAWAISCGFRRIDCALRGAGQRNIRTYQGWTLKSVVSGYHRGDFSSDVLRPTGYQQGILAALGSSNGERFAVRSIDRWYPDQVQELFGTRVYSIQPKGREAKQFVVKSASVRHSEQEEVTDWRGFARAWIEIHGSLDLGMRKHRDGSHSKALRLRVFGPVEILSAIMRVLPAPEKKIQHIRNRVPGGYTGETDAIYYQSPAQVCDILDYLRDEPRNERVWAVWDGKIKEGAQS